MFDINARGLIALLIDESKLSSMYVVPLYVRIYQDRYRLCEMEQSATQNPTSLRVGFGAKISIFDKHSFPKDAMFQFDNVSTFVLYNDDKQVDEKYIVFESGKITEEELSNDKLSDVCRQINKEVAFYYNMLKERLEMQYAELRRKRIAEMMADE